MTIDQIHKVLLEARGKSIRVAGVVTIVVGLDENCKPTLSLQQFTGEIKEKKEVVAEIIIRNADRDGPLLRDALAELFPRDIQPISIPPIKHEDIKV